MSLPLDYLIDVLCSLYVVLTSFICPSCRPYAYRILGEIGDTTRWYSESLVSQILYVLYAFLVVILLANVLIAIVTDSYGVIKNERAAVVFWLNRLDFVAEMDAIVKAVNLIVTCGSARPIPTISAHGPSEDGETAGTWRGGTREDQTKATNEKNKGPPAPFRRAWASIMSLFDSNLFKDNDISPLSVDFFIYSFLRFLAVFLIVPVWLILGLVTAGWLWPPQVREFIFAQSRAVVTRADIAAGVKAEVDNLKSELKSLRSELKHSLKKDRKEMTDAKSELEFAQDDVRVSFGVAAVGAGLDIALGVSIGVCLRGARDFPKLSVQSTKCACHLGWSLTCFANPLNGRSRSTT